MKDIPSSRAEDSQSSSSSSMSFSPRPRTSRRELRGSKATSSGSRAGNVCRERSAVLLTHEVFLLRFGDRFFEVETNKRSSIREERV
ncbi:hypothetical protein EYF80_053894 [Liparis tanakae]|uniref:Uncharacterized protein n=1 Tax=Liparis tanakae TaxID=230148 RepID=A0A4Z2F473_9TELE|nr:hypothetical protein EYF80_053894 [Liparis tanakae]